MSYFKFLIFKDFLIHLGQTLDHLPINLKLVNQYLFFHFVSQQNANSMGNREDLLKSQYKPLKRGISNMMRLQGSGAVAMPIEIRLQILASSKDVIHSWAIPSAGIKIDCIPGYSSHRIMIFFTPGIY
jgi:heme/copper-type cytochrome/quinol oxidase subunit 2